MKRRYFWFQGILALALFAAVNVVVRQMGKNSPPRALIRHLDATPAIDAVFLGNSLMEAGYNEEAFRTAKVAEALNPFGLGLGSTSAVEHLQLLHRAIAKQPQLSLCVYGFFDFQLSEPPPWPIDGNRMMSYYVEPEIAAGYYSGSLLDRRLFPILGKIPCFTERFTVWAKVEQLRRKLADIGMAKAEINQFGRASDFAALEAKSTDDFRANCQRYTTTGFSPAMTELLDTARTHTQRTILVVMPMASRHRAVFYTLPEWKAYLAQIQKRAADKNVLLIDASSWVTGEEYFADGLHLNKEGAHQFSQHLAQELRRLPDTQQPPQTNTL